MQHCMLVDTRRARQTCHRHARAAARHQPRRRPPPSSSTRSSPRGIFDYIELTNTGAAPSTSAATSSSDSNDNNDARGPGGHDARRGWLLRQRVDDPWRGQLRSRRSLTRRGVFTPGRRRLWTASTGPLNRRRPRAVAPTARARCRSPASPARAREHVPGPVAASAWPGGAAIATGDVAGAFADNMSGLAYQPSGTAARGTLWAVRNSSGGDALHAVQAHLQRHDLGRLPGWAGGKRLLYPHRRG